MASEDRKRRSARAGPGRTMRPPQPEFRCQAVCPHVDERRGARHGRRVRKPGADGWAPRTRGDGGANGSRVHGTDRSAGEEPSGHRGMPGEVSKGRRARGPRGDPPTVLGTALANENEPAGLASQFHRPGPRRLRTHGAQPHGRVSLPSRSGASPTAGYGGTADTVVQTPALPPVEPSGETGQRSAQRSAASTTPTPCCAAPTSAP